MRLSFCWQSSKRCYLEENYTLVVKNKMQKKKIQSLQTKSCTRPVVTWINMNHVPQRGTSQELKNLSLKQTLHQHWGTQSPKLDENSSLSPDDSNQFIKRKQTKWNHEEYKQVMTSFYTELKNPQKNITDQTSKMERYVRNWNKILSEPKYAYQIRWDTLENKRLSTTEIDHIKLNISQSTKSQNTNKNEVRVEIHNDRGMGTN